MSAIDNVASNPGMTKESTRELTAHELDTVTGAATPKLYEAACKGTHLPEVVIETYTTESPTVRGNSYGWNDM